MLKNQTKPICFFDLEATGLKISEARIIQIAATRIEPGEDKAYKAILHTVNPMQRIDEHIVELTGVSNEEAGQSSPFREIAHEVFDFFKGCDFAGYNLMRFDVPLLAEEFERVGMDHPFRDCQFIDVQSIFHQREPRDLSGAVRYYLGKDHTDAHDAMGDTVATLEVLKAQLDRYDDLPKDIQGLHDMATRGKEFADPTGFFYWNDDGRLYYKFGKHRDTPVEKYDRYLDWMLREDFPLVAKRFINDYLDGVYDPPKDETVPVEEEDQDGLPF